MRKLRNPAVIIVAGIIIALAIGWIIHAVTGILVGITR